MPTIPWPSNGESYPRDEHKQDEIHTLQDSDNPLSPQGKQQLYSLLEQQLAATHLAACSSLQRMLTAQHHEALKAIENICNEAGLGNDRRVISSKSVDFTASSRLPGTPDQAPENDHVAMRKSHAASTEGGARATKVDSMKSSLSRRSKKKIGGSGAADCFGSKGVKSSADLQPSRENEKRSSADLQVMRNQSDDAKREARGSIVDKSQNAAAFKKPKGTFADAADMKAKVKEAIMKPEYNVANFYHSTGCFQHVARQAWFDNLTLGIIGLNALWIWIDTDYNLAETLPDADIGFQIGENMFCVYFSAELFIRYMALANKRDGLKDGWFVFDSSLVAMMVVETWLLNFIFFLVGGASRGFLGNASVLRLIRLLRLTRMARMVRLLRAMPELMILVKGISVATRSVFFTLCLLTIFIYVFGIAFTQLCKDTDLGYEFFPTVPDAMSTLLLRATLPDFHPFVSTVGDDNWFFYILGLIFVLLSTLTVLNMLIGVLCEVVNVVSAVEKEQMTVQFVKTKLMEMIDHCGVDADGNKCLSKKEFEDLLLLPEGARIIEEVGVDVVGLVDFVDDIFKDGRELSFVDLMELVLQLRSANVATVRDIVDLRKLVAHIGLDVADNIESIVESQLGQYMESQLKEVKTALKGLEVIVTNAQGQVRPVLPGLPAHIDNVNHWSPPCQPTSDDVFSPSSSPERVPIASPQRRGPPGVHRPMSGSRSAQRIIYAQRPNSAQRPISVASQRPTSASQRPNSVGNQRPNSAKQLRQRAEWGRPIANGRAPPDAPMAAPLTPLGDRTWLPEFVEEAV